MSKKPKSSAINLKTIMVGNGVVGKSTFLLRYIENVYHHQVATMGLDFRLKTVVRDGQTFNLELWDSAGQQRFRAIVFTYCKNSKAACVVFDITDMKSVEDCGYWLKQLGIHISDDIPKVLIGNKSDLLGGVENKEKHLEEVMRLVKGYEEEFGVKYFQASAKTGENVKEVFDYLFEELYRKYKAGKDKGTGGVKLKPQQLNPKSKQGCCK